MRIFLVIAFVGFACACSSPEQQFVADCEAAGIKRELCDCLVKRLPQERREQLLNVPENVQGEWVLPSDMTPALSCFDIATSSGAA